MPKSNPLRTLRAVATLTAIGVFPLILVGAGVTSQDAGMAYPDWPTSAGHLVNPPQWWQSNDTRWEHGHRLMGWAVGMTTILVVVFSWRRGGLFRVGGVGLLLAIIIQGVLGGLRVTEVSTVLAMVHGIWGQLCFCLACAMVLFASPAWSDDRDRFRVRAGAALQRLCVAATTSVFIQLVLGAAYRHFGVQLALFGHVFWAVVVVMLIGWLVVWVVGQHPAKHLISRLCQVLALLMIGQLLLGGLALVVTTMGGAWSPIMKWFAPSAHVAVGALLLACSVSLTLCCYRMIQPSVQPSRSSVMPGVTIA